MEARPSIGLRLLARLGPVAALIGLVFVAAPTPSSATTCEVNVYQAWDIAQRRGWGFQCLQRSALPGSIVTNLFLPDPPNRIMCLFRTGPVPVPTPPAGRIRLFENSSGSRPNLRNGWRVHQVEFIGAQWQHHDADPGARINAETRLTRVGTTTRIRLSRLVLRKTGGNCANALDEAF